uniref:DNA-directed DNA polymerase n=1 Tax=Plectus sambesii TaxID=2011161 RepID=A0A914UUB4_9BILA
MDLVVKAIENSETLEVLDAFATSNCWLNSRSRYLAIRKREDYLLSRDKPKTYYFGSKEWFETIWGERELPEEETHQDEQEVPTAEDENTDTTTPHLNIQVGHGIEENISDDPKIFYEIREEYAERVKRFRTEGHTYRLQFQNLQQAADIGETAIQVFNEVLDKVAEDGEEDERIGLCIRHPALESAILVPFRKREEISGEAVLAEIERVQQSNKELDIEEEMRVTVTRVKLPGGSGRDRQRGLWQPWHNRHMVKGGCFITINNNDNLCCARAIVTGIASLHKDESPEAKKCYDVIRQGDRARCTAQRKKAEELMDQAGLKNHKGACGLDELKKLQEAVKDYQLKVFWKENFNKLWFKGPEKENVISLYLHDDHYDVITSVAAFFGRSYFCHSCDQVYEKREEHRCEKMCRYCYRSPPCMGDSSRHYCTNCNRYFPSIDCFNEHQRPTSITIGNGNEKRKIATSICRRFHCCRDCGKLVNQQKMKEKKHTCYETYCNICKEYMPQKHQCYMKKLKKREENEKKQIGQEKDAPKFIIFDFECQQCEKVGETELGPTYLHKVNYCIAHKVCDSCKTRPIEEGCPRCGPKRKFDFKTLEEFCSWLFGEGGRGSVCFAHNMKGYDGQFLLQFLHKQGLKPDIIMRGLEILCLKACAEA